MKIKYDNMLKSMTKKQLIQFCEDREIKYYKSWTKTRIVEEIKKYV